MSYLLGIIVSTGLASFFFFNQFETIGSIYGEIPRHFPAPAFPDITVERVVTLLPSAFVIAILVGLQSLLTARVADEMTKSKHSSKKN